MSIILVLLTINHSLYFAQFSAPIVAIFAILVQAFFIISTNKLHISKYTILIFNFLIFVIITDFLILCFNTQYEILTNRVILWPTLIFLTLLASGFINNHPVILLNRIFYIVIAITCTSAILQSVAFYGLGIHIDFNAPITGELSRNFAPGANLSASGMGFRASGFFSEPGNLGTALSYLYFIYKLTVDTSRRSRKEFLLRTLVYLTFLLTFSIFAFVWMAVHIVHDIFTLRMKPYSRVMFILIGFILLVPAVNYVFFRLSHPVLGVAALAQIHAVLGFINTLSLTEVLFGLTHLRDLRADSQIVLGDGSFFLFQYVLLGIVREAILYFVFLYIFISTKHKLSFACFIIVLSAGKYNFGNYWLFYLLFIYLNLLYKRDQVRSD